jgi:hypothetical protein
VIGDLKEKPAFQDIAEFITAGFLGSRIGPHASEAGDASIVGAILNLLIPRVAHGVFEILREHVDFLTD